MIFIELMHENESMGTVAFPAIPSQGAIIRIAAQSADQKDVRGRVEDVEFVIRQAEMGKGRVAHVRVHITL